MNENVWVRRMTLCHELGHLPWDPDPKLQKLMVDPYPDVEENYFEAYRDPVEIRANAFAISFLAPGPAVEEIVDAEPDPRTALARIMERFGISATAAKHHANNVARLDSSSVPNRDLPRPSDEWIARENLAIDYFPISATPITRRGRFASHVAEAYSRQMISADTAAMALKCSEEEFISASADILSLLALAPS